MDLDYRTIFKELNELNIDYLVIGGLAVNFHGVPRMTYDIDLMILLQSENILNLVNRLTQWGYKPKVPINPRDLADKSKRDSWIKDKGMQAVNFYSETLSIGEIDIIIDSPMPYDKLKNKAVTIELGEVKIPTISIHDLIELKSQTGRKQDISDVEHLRMVLER
jgi:predicted nucleotidyltransferase